MSGHYVNNLTSDFSLCFSEHLTGHPIYLPLYHMIINNRSNYSRTYVAEIDISKKSYRIIGKRVEYAVVLLDSMVNDTLYYYNYSRKDDKWLRRINIHSVNRPWSWSERFFHFYHELLFFFRDLF